MVLNIAKWTILLAILFIGNCLSTAFMDKTKKLLWLIKKIIIIWKMYLIKKNLLVVSLGLY